MCDLLTVGISVALSIISMVSGCPVGICRVKKTFAGKTYLQGISLKMVDNTAYKRGLFVDVALETPI